jgi:hypothetical protein
LRAHRRKKERDNASSDIVAGAIGEVERALI